MPVAKKRLFKKEMAYKCPECPKEYAYESYLRQHMVTHDPARPKPFVCPECGRSFPNKGPLSHHRQARHGIDSETRKSRMEAESSKSIDSGVSGVFSEESRTSEDSERSEFNLQEEDHKTVVDEGQSSGTIVDAADCVPVPSETVFTHTFNDNIMFPDGGTCQVDYEIYGSDSNTYWTDLVNLATGIVDYNEAFFSQMGYNHWVNNDSIYDDIANILNAGMEKDIATVALHFNV